GPSWSSCCRSASSPSSCSATTSRPTTSSNRSSPASPVFCSTISSCWPRASRCCGERFFRCCRNPCGAPGGRSRFGGASLGDLYPWQPGIVLRVLCFCLGGDGCHRDQRRIFARRGCDLSPHRPGHFRLDGAAHSPQYAP